ncbi:MAG: hypothetical protein ACLTYN_08135 [Dysosmobacter welbionis]
MEDIKKTDAAAAVPQSEKDTLKAKYGKVFRVSCSVRRTKTATRWSSATTSSGPASPLMTAT